MSERIFLARQHREEISYAIQEKLDEIHFNPATDKTITVVYDDWTIELEVKIPYMDVIYEGEKEEKRLRYGYDKPSEKYKH